MTRYSPLVNKERQKRADKKLEQKIAKESQHLLNELGIAQTHDVSILVKDKLKPGVQNKGREVAAQVSGSWPYRDIYIDVSRDWAKKASSSEIRELMLHEVLHIVLYGFIQHERTADGHKKRDKTYICAEENTVDLVTQWLMQREVKKE